MAQSQFNLIYTYTISKIQLSFGHRNTLIIHLNNMGYIIRMGMRSLVGMGMGGGEVRGDEVTDNRVHFYYFSVFERKKRLRSFKNPSVQCDFQSEI